MTRSLMHILAMASFVYGAAMTLYPVKLAAEGLRVDDRMESRQERREDRRENVGDGVEDDVHDLGCGGLGFAHLRRDGFDQIAFVHG